MPSEIVFAKPDARQLAQQFVSYVEQKEALLVKTPTGRLMQKAQVHGPVEPGYGSCMGVLVRAACEAREAEEPVHSDIEAMDARGDRTCVDDLVCGVCNIKKQWMEGIQHCDTVGEDEVC